MTQTSTENVRSLGHAPALDLGQAIEGQHVGYMSGFSPHCSHRVSRAAEMQKNYPLNMHAVSIIKTIPN